MTVRVQAKKEEASTKSPADLKFEEMQQYANNLDVQVNYRTFFVEAYVGRACHAGNLTSVAGILSSRAPKRAC